MSAPVAVGTLQTQSTLFNSGFLTVNGKWLGEITNITCTLQATEKNFYALNSIIKRKVRRSNLNSNVSFEMEGGLYRELLKVYFSASSPASGGQIYTMKDGQQNAATVYITAYEDDDTTKAYQIEVVSPVLLTHTLQLASQEFVKVPVEIACTQIKMYVDDTVAN